MKDTNNDNKNIDDDSQILYEISDGAMASHIDLDGIMVGAEHERKSKGIDAEHLDKFWRIDPAVAHKTIDITSQPRIMKYDPKLSRNDGT